jgi:hypothetical protein
MSGRSPNQPRDLPGVKLFQWLEFSVGVSADATNDVAKFMLDDVTTDIFVRQIKLLKIVIIEKVTERPVPHIVQQTGDTHHALDASSRRHIAATVRQ